LELRRCSAARTLAAADHFIYPLEPNPPRFKPKNWERIDFSLYDATGEYAGGEYLFRRDVKTSDRAWTEGFNMNDPQCQVDLG